MSQRPPLRRRRLAAGMAAGVLAGTTALALRSPIPDWELRLTEWINDAPDAVAWTLYPVMQLGAGATPILVGGVVYGVTRDRWASAAVAAAGVGSWFAAKAVKQLVGRSRPLEFVPGLDVREGDGLGLGFPSGHAAVAASLAITVAAIVPPRFRPILGVLAGLVGLARIVFGVHLPVDVVGGWSLGILVGLGAVTVADRLRPDGTPG